MNHSIHCIFLCHLSALCASAVRFSLISQHITEFKRRFISLDFNQVLADLWVL